MAIFVPFNAMLKGVIMIVYVLCRINLCSVYNVKALLSVVI